MIRVSTDKRKIHSAELLVNGLIKCIEKKDFTEINVSDLQRASGVSRATFYRLFDNVQDILAYKCQAIALEIPQKYRDLPAERTVKKFRIFVRAVSSQYYFRRKNGLSGSGIYGRSKQPFDYMGETWEKETSEQLIEIFRGFDEIMPVMLC